MNPFFVCLPDIYDKLILGNFYFSLHKVLNKSFVDSKTVIINLSEQKLKSDTVLIYNFDLEDSYRQSYEYFKHIMNQCIYIINDAKKNKKYVIVNCAAGVNRSCSAIIAFAISNNLIADNSIDYIKYTKNEKYGNIWPTLTNLRFVEYLRMMEFEKKINKI